MYKILGKNIINFNQCDSEQYAVVYTDNLDLIIDKSQYKFTLISDTDEVNISIDGILDVSKTMVSQNVIIVCEFDGHSVSKGVKLRDNSFFQGDSVAAPFLKLDDNLPVNSRLFGEIIENDKMTKEEIHELKRMIPENLMDKITILQLGLIEQYEENIELQQQLMETQMKITEMLSRFEGVENNNG